MVASDFCDTLGISRCVIAAEAVSDEAEDGAAALADFVGTGDFTTFSVGRVGGADFSADGLATERLGRAADGAAAVLFGAGVDEPDAGGAAELDEAPSLAGSELDAAALALAACACGSCLSRRGTSRMAMARSAMAPTATARFVPAGRSRGIVEPRAGCGDGLIASSRRLGAGRRDS